jgi:hypothetical protein
MEVPLRGPGAEPPLVWVLECSVFAFGVEGIESGRLGVVILAFSFSVELSTRASFRELFVFRAYDL